MTSPRPLAAKLGGDPGVLFFGIDPARCHSA
jgi:hypothetical protein